MTSDHFKPNAQEAIGEYNAQKRRAGQSKLVWNKRTRKMETVNVRPECIEGSDGGPLPDYEIIRLALKRLYESDDFAVEDDKRLYMRDAFAALERMSKGDTMTVALIENPGPDGYARIVRTMDVGKLPNGTKLYARMP